MPNLNFLKSLLMAVRERKAAEALVVAGFTLVTTASFTYMEYIAGMEGEFPFFHLGCLLVGALVIVSLKYRYKKIYISEAVGAFTLFVIMMSLFTTPVAEALRDFIR